jgi:hypothetical protein
MTISRNIKTIDSKQDVYLHKDNADRIVTLRHKDRSTFSSFSLLSWDGRTVSSDVYAELTRMAILTDNMGTNNEIKDPERKIISEKGLVWSADGMLLLFFKGVRVGTLTESRVEAGVPMLNKVPYVQRLFSNTAIGREIQEQTMYGILTIRMLAPNEEPQTAVVIPEVIRREKVDGNRAMR